MNINILEENMRSEGYDDDYISICTKYARNLADNGMPIVFDVTHLGKLMGLKPEELYKYYVSKEILYNDVSIPKRTGGVRVLSIPCDNLKFIQKWILDNILSEKKFDSCVTGFVSNRSIVTNAIKHVKKECVINLDIKDFFPSVSFSSVYRIFYDLGYSRHLSMFFAGISTLKGKLPQGAPTSPMLSNLACKNLDNRLKNLSEKIGADYSRYADDITFSGDKDIAKYIALMKRIIEEEKFKVNNKKVRVHYQHHKQMVTGLIVNEKLAVPSRTKRYLRMQIHYANKYGVNESLMNQGLNKSNYQGHLFGLAYFIKMVEEDCGNKFIEQLNNVDWES